MGTARVPGKEELTGHLDGLGPPAATERSLFFNSSTLALESGSLSGREGWGERREKDICKHQKQRMGKTETKKILQKP